MDTNDEGRALDRFISKASAPDQLLPDELSSLIETFSATDEESRAKSYIALTSVCQTIRASLPPGNDEVGTEKLAKLFGPYVNSRLRDTDDAVLSTGVTFLTALFQVDWQSASSIFQHDGVLENIIDAIELPQNSRVHRNVAHLLGQACGYKPSRSVIPSQLISWLENQSRKTEDAAIRAAAGVALIKLTKAASTDKEEVRPELSAKLDDELVVVMKQLVLDGNVSSLSDAMEGIAYLSVEPSIKEIVSSDRAFLTKLFSLVPSRKSANSSSSRQTLTYGILVIIANLCGYRPQLTEEQEQIEKLKRVTKSEAGKPQLAEADNSLDDNEHVKQRAKRVVDAGGLAVFPPAVSGTDSLGIKTIAGKALLGIIEDRDNRGKVLQSGGARTLLSIIKSILSARSTGALPTSGAKYLEVTDLEPIQALAKLAITSSPIQVFGPDVGAIYDGIRPLSLMLQHPSAKLLQRFEAMMALTNLSSHSPEVASRVANAEGLLNKVEFLLLEDHTLVRRAAMELICNLITGSDDIFERYGGGKDCNEAIKSRVQILAALSDVEDLPTRLAASGAMATILPAPGACEALVALQTERGRILPIITQLIDPSALVPEERPEDVEDLTADAGLAHRGVICARSLFFGIKDTKTRKKLAQEATKVGLMQALVNTIKDPQMRSNEAVLRPAMETLKVIVSDASD